MATVLAGAFSSYTAYRTIKWALSSRQPSDSLEHLSPEEWLRRTDLVMLLFSLDFYTTKHKKDPVVKKLAEQVKKVDKLVDKLQGILRWKNDGWHWAYRSWAWTGEEKLFETLKVEYAILKKRIDLLKKLNQVS